MVAADEKSIREDRVEGASEHPVGVVPWTFGIPDCSATDGEEGEGEGGGGGLGDEAVQRYNNYNGRT